MNSVPLLLLTRRSHVYCNKCHRCPKTIQQLENLIICREFFHGARIILVLPKSADVPVDSIHVLAPSFIMHEDQDYRTICEVVEKIRSSFQWSSFGTAHTEL